MNDLKTNPYIQIGIGMSVCLLIVHIFPDIQALGACTAVIMCTQSSANFSFKSGYTRLLGVVIGGILGVCVILANSVIRNDYVFLIMAGVGIMLTLLGCRLAKMIPITARVSAITFALVVLVEFDTASGHINYALNRFIGTLVGALVALVIAFLWEFISKKFANHKASELNIKAYGIPRP